MRFEWDRQKAERHFRKHGVRFEVALTVFYDPLAATMPDPDHSNSEDPWITFGYTLERRLVVVSHTDRESVVRLISARFASRGERWRHEAEG